MPDLNWTLLVATILWIAWSPAVLGFEIILAGFDRTGVTSMRKALHTLGYRRIHVPYFHPHFEEAYLELMRNSSRENILALAEKLVSVGVRVVSDVPWYMFALPLSERYPHAKVILTKRADSGAWWASFQAWHEYRYLASFPPYRFKGLLWYTSVKREWWRLRWRSHGCSGFEYIRDADRDCMVSAYDRHNADVVARVPAARLLTFQAQQGWEPLCEFLNVSVPAVPYPVENSGMERNRTLRWTVWVQIAIFNAIWMCAPLVLCWSRFRRSFCPERKKQR